MIFSFLCVTKFLTKSICNEENIWAHTFSHGCLAQLTLHCVETAHRDRSTHLPRATGVGKGGRERERTNKLGSQFTL